MTLTYQEARELLSYDPESGKLVWRVNRTGTAKAGDEVGGPHLYKGKAYRTFKVKGQYHFAHRVAYLLVTGVFPEDEIDHENGNGMDNRWSNLRVVDRNTNMKNLRMYSTNTSGVQGVYWNKSLNRWHARIHHEGKRVHLGFYTNVEDAVAARTAAEVTYGFHKNHGSVRPL